MEKEFTELVNSNRGLIFKVCNLYCHDPESRKDLFQEVVLQLWKSFPGFRRASSGSTWIYRVALNTAISNFRRESRKPEKQPLGLSELQIPDMVETTGNSGLTELGRAIDQLTGIEKAIILLYLDEKSYDEISDVMGISISNVGVRLSRVKDKLSKLIKTE
jgi:RNA polymerase sigma-70 factor (ECF subfamily)